MLFSTPFPHIIQDRIRLMDNDVFTLKTKLTLIYCNSKMTRSSECCKVTCWYAQLCILSFLHSLDILWYSTCWILTKSRLMDINSTFKLSLILSNVGIKNCNAAKFLLHISNRPLNYSLSYSHNMQNKYIISEL